MVYDLWRDSFIFFLIILLGVYLQPFLKYFMLGKVSYVSKEPPEVASVVPYIGHLIGIFWYKNDYYTKLSKYFRFPIFKLPILRGQLYIVNSPKLIATIERQPNTVSLWHVEVNAIGQIAGLNRDAINTVSHGVGDDTNSFWLKGLRAIHHAMKPGEGVNNMLLKAAQTSAASLRQFDSQSGGMRVDLWKWITHEITLSHTDAIYGHRNPYRDPKVEVAFWDFAKGAWKLLLGKYSNLLAPSSYTGREKVVSAFKDYFGTSDSHSTSHLTEARTAHMAMLGIEDMARMECVNGLAIFSMTVPSTFWTIIQIYGNPQLLQRVRDLANAALTKELVAGVEKRTINVIKIQQSLEIQAIVQEVLRFRNTGISPRLVREDVVLHEQYLLKKDSIVIIPNRAIHFDERIWGESVEMFDENRFSKLSKKAKVPLAAYRGFGGGATICAGKHFAIEGIAVFIALFALKYDLRPLERDWFDLEQDVRDMGFQLGAPKGEFLVDVVPCESTSDVEWCFEL